MQINVRRKNSTLLQTGLYALRVIMEAIELSYKELRGLSEKQLSEHYNVLYSGYVKKVNEIRESLNRVDSSLANVSYSEIRELKLELSFVLNGVRLHEMYFENMTPERQEIGTDLRLRINSDFGSFEKWEKEFRALGLAARGWVVLALNDEGFLENYLCDWHSHGGIWRAKPLLVLDVYEHAYFIDYGTNRGAYIDAFLKNINWKVISRRFFASDLK